MHPFAIAVGLLVLAFVLLDAFQTIILPRRPVGRFRITRVFFLFTWTPFSPLVQRLASRRVRDQLLSIFGPLSLLLLMVVWALTLMTGFALIFFGLGTPFTDAIQHATPLTQFRSCLYFSGTNLFTLGLGDVVPATASARFLMVSEAGTGLGFVALVIGYVPVLYGAFSHREVTVALLDARAGSPPTAGELLLRHAFDGGAAQLTLLLSEWERWSAEMLESHVSYPILCYYRSQHDNQSWLSSITAVLDTCALLIAVLETPSTRQAQLTFAIARHTLVDLGHVFHRDDDVQRCMAEAKAGMARTKQASSSALQPAHPMFACTAANRHEDRLGNEEFAGLCESLRAAGLKVSADGDVRERLAAIRLLYEPHARALSEYLLMDLPRWTPPPPDANRRPDPWTAVSNLRSRNAAPGAPSSPSSVPQHVSAQSTASQLGDRDSHGF